MTTCRERAAEVAEHGRTPTAIVSSLRRMRKSWPESKLFGGMFAAWYLLLSMPALFAQHLRIVGGGPAPSPQLTYPYMAVLRVYRTGVAGVSYSLCGASLIVPDTVLTAAHCLPGDTVSVQVRLGVQTTGIPTGGEEVWTSNFWLLHPEYNITSSANDVAIVKLGGRSAYTPVQLDYTGSNASDVGASVVVIGFGVTVPSPVDYAVTDYSYIDDTDYLPTVLQRSKLGVLRDSWCQKWAEYGYDRIKQICIGDLTGASDTCQGDSGGPVLSNTNGAWGVSAQIGIVSYGGTCAHMYDSGVYTRVSAYFGWISSVVADLPKLPITTTGHSLFPGNGAVVCGASPMEQKVSLDCGALPILRIITATWIRSTVLACSTSTPPFAPTVLAAPAEVGAAAFSCVGRVYCDVQVSQRVFGDVPVTMNQLYQMRKLGVSVQAECGFQSPPLPPLPSPSQSAAMLYPILIIAILVLSFGFAYHCWVNRDGNAKPIVAAQTTDDVELEQLITVQTHPPLPITLWTQRDVGRWLDEAGLGHYQGVFTMSGEVLETMTDTGLQELGLNVAAYRNVVLQLIEDSRLAKKANLEAASTVVASADNGTTTNLSDSEATALLSLPT